ncbi:hypothetical protein [Lactovum odontotermitis]
MMDPNESSHLNSAEIIARVEARMKEADAAAQSAIKSLVKALNGKRLELQKLLEGDKAKYRRVSEELHSYEEQFEQVEETNRQIETFMNSPEYSEAVLNKMLGMTVQEFYKQQQEIKENIAFVGRGLEGLQSDIDKASYIIQKMEEMEDGYLNLFSDEKQVDLKKVTESLGLIQDLINNDKIPEEGNL